MQKLQKLLLYNPEAKKIKEKKIDLEKIAESLEIREIKNIKEIGKNEIENRTIFLAGGDGTLHKFINNYFTLEYELFLIKGGTQNTVAYSLGYKGLNKSIEKYKQGKYKKISLNPLSIKIDSFNTVYGFIFGALSITKVTKFYLDPQFSFLGIKKPSKAKAAGIMIKSVLGSFLNSLNSYEWDSYGFGFYKEIMKPEKMSFLFKDELGEKLKIEKINTLLVTALPFNFLGMKIGKDLNDFQMYVKVIYALINSKLVANNVLLPRAWIGKFSGINIETYEQVKIKNRLEWICDGEFYKSNELEIKKSSQSLTFIIPK